MWSLLLHADQTFASTSQRIVHPNGHACFCMHGRWDARLPQTHVCAETIGHPSRMPSAILISKSGSLRPKLAVGKACSHEPAPGAQQVRIKSTKLCNKNSTRRLPKPFHQPKPFDELLALGYGQCFRLKPAILHKRIARSSVAVALYKAMGRRMF